MSLDSGFVLSIACMVIGFIFGLVGLYLLAKQKFIREADGETIVEIPWLGRLKTNYPSLAAFFIGAGLVIYPVYSQLTELGYEHEVYIIDGSVKREGATSHEGTMIGVIPGRYLKPTDSNGDFKLDVYVGESSYTGIAFYRDLDSRDIHLSGITIENNRGSLNHVFRRKP